MRTYFALLICTLFLTGLHAQEHTPKPLDIVKKRMRALNDHDLESFIAAHDEDVAFFVFPDRPLGRGRSHVRKIFAPMITEGKVHVEIGETMVSENYVVMKTVTSIGDTAESSVAIYEVRDGLIRSVRFLRDDIRAQQIDVKQKQSN